MEKPPDTAGTDESGHTTSHRSARNARVEIITRNERRRRWSLDQKREIVAESFGSDLTPTEVARKHSISSGQLYTWRQEVLGTRAAVLTQAVPQFAEVELTALTAPVPTPASMPVPSVPEPSTSPGLDGRIEIVFPDDIIVRVDAHVDTAALRRVLDALRLR